MPGDNSILFVFSVFLLRFLEAAFPDKEIRNKDAISF